MIENKRLQHNIRKTWIRLLICTAAAILAVTGGIIRAFAEETQEEAYARALASKNQSQDPGSALLYPADERDALSALPEKRYTVMVYMIGSNLESRLGNATKDMMEMEASGLDYTHNNLLVYTGGSRRWVGNVKANCNGVYDMSKDTAERMTAATRGNADMGDPGTLTRFLEFAQQYYPAEHYALILWDHGGGPLWGYGNDELFDSDSLLLEEMEEAMEASGFGPERKLDWVGFDACLMGSLECMSIWEPFASYYIGSEELEPGDGWDYSFLSVLNETADPLEIAGSVIDHFKAYYEANRTEYYDPDITLSCSDLSILPEVENALGMLSSSMAEQLETGGYARVSKVRSAAKSFGLLEGSRGEEDYSYDLVDLGNLSEGLSPYFPSQCALLSSKLSSMVKYSCSNVSGSSGVTMYYPSRNGGQYTQMAASYQEAGALEEYVSFLTRMARIWLSGAGHDWVLGSPQTGDDEYTLQLTQEQLDNMLSANYTVITKLADGTYCPVLSGRSITPDENGMLHIPKDPQIVVLCTGRDSAFPWIVAQTQEDAEGTAFRTETTRLGSSASFYSHGQDMQSVPVSILLRSRPGEDVLTISSVSEEEGVQEGGKATIDASTWAAVYETYHSLIPARDSDGRIKPCRSWVDTEVIGFNMIPIDGSFWFEYRPVSALGDDFLFQIELVDINGERYATEPHALTPETDYFMTEERTESGKAKYQVYKDHAVLVEYSGVDKVLTIPETVEGVPVTQIGRSAVGKINIFSNSGYTPVREVVLPDSIEKIGMKAFYCCFDLEKITLGSSLKQIGPMAFEACEALEKLDLPAGLERIESCAFEGCSNLREAVLPGTLVYLGEGVFMGCSALESFTVPDGCAAVRFEDGALLDPDGKILLAFPGGRTGTVRIPDGVKRIGYGTFESAALSQVVFPDSLEEIGDYAFFDCRLLEVPVFPETLETIGTQAFGASSAYYEPDDIPAEPTEICLGKNVRHVGTYAFDRFMAKYFSVSEDNPWFSTLEGCLTNKARDTLYVLKTGREFTARVPEGIASMDWECLQYLQNYDFFTYDEGDLYLPSTLVNFPESAFSAHRLNVHVPQGSAAEQYFTNHGYEFDYETDPQYEELKVTDENGSWVYRLYTDHAQLLSWEGQQTHLTVPDEVEGLPVTVIGSGDDSAVDSMDLVSLTLPESVTQINSGAIDCWLLEEFRLPSGVQFIGDRALGLSNAVYENGLELPDTLQHLGSCFSHGLYRGTMTIRPSLKYIAPDAFADCRAFEGFIAEGENETYTVRDGALFLPDRITLVACAAPDGIVHIPDGTVKISEKAFSENTSITRLYLPDTVESIEPHAFDGCMMLESISFGKGLKRIGAWAFALCEELAEFKLPEGLQEIEEYAFYEVAAVDINLPESLTFIGARAFSEYDDYEETDEDAVIPEKAVLRIGPNVAYIGDMAFDTQIPAVFEVSQENMTYSSRDGFLMDKSGELLMMAPAGLSGEVHLPEGCTAVLGKTVHEDTDITDLYIPDSVTYIAEIAFEYDMEETGEVDEYGFEEYKPVYRFVIHCSRGSYAHQYALEYGIDFILEDEEKMDADAEAAQVTVLDTQTWEQSCAALSTYQFLRTLLGGNLDFSRTSSWGQEHTYQIRWTLTTNGFRIDRSAAQLLENEQYCKEVLRCIMTYLPGSYDSAGSGTQDDAQPYRWDEHISREMLLDILKDLSESESWKTQVEQYRQLGDEWLLEGRQVDEQADEDCRFHDPSCGFDTLLAIDSMLDVLAAFKAQEVPAEYFWLLRDLRAAEYTGMMEYYTGGQEEEYLRTQHGRLLSMTPFSLKEAETFSPKGGFGGPSFSDMIVYIGDEKEGESE